MPETRAQDPCLATFGVGRSCSAPFTLLRQFPGDDADVQIGSLREVPGSRHAGMRSLRVRRDETS
jgi:hypothetical protein